MQQIKHSNKNFLKRTGFAKVLDDADRNAFENNVHLYRFYFVTLVVAILVSTILKTFIAVHVRPKA